MIRAWILVVVACGSNDAAQPGDPPRHVAATDAIPADYPMDAPKQDFAVVEDRVPDDPQWHAAVRIAANSWTPSFNKIGATVAKLSPLTSPSGEIAPFVLTIVASKGDEVVFRGGALVGNGLVINGGGKPRLTAHLASIGFPKTRVPLGHLVEMVHLTAAVTGWTRPPSSVGFEYFEQPQGAAGQLPATLGYDGDGALLTLYRDGKTTTPSIERLEIRFDATAQMSTTAARKLGAGAWETFSE